MRGDRERYRDMRRGRDMYVSGERERERERDWETHMRRAKRMRDICFRKTCKMGMDRERNQNDGTGKAQRKNELFAKNIILYIYAIIKLYKISKIRTLKK